MKMIKRLFYGFFLCSLFVSYGYADSLLYSNDFESGSLSGLTTLRAEISNDVSRSGSYSAKVVHTETALIRKEFDLNTMLNNPEVTIKYWWYTANSWPTGTGVKYLRLRGPDQILQFEFWFSEKLGSDPLSLGGLVYGKDGSTYGYWNGSKYVSTIYPGSQSLNKGRWTEFIIQYKLNNVGSDDGYLKITIDGVEKYYKENFRFRHTNTAYTQFYMPSNIGTTSSNAINYIDDIEIWAGKSDSNSVTLLPPPDLRIVE